MTTSLDTMSSSRLEKGTPRGSIFDHEEVFSSERFLYGTFLEPQGDLAWALELYKFVKKQGRSRDKSFELLFFVSL